MTINRIQFQAGRSLLEFLKRYCTGDKCEAGLEQARCPGGFACPCANIECVAFSSTIHTTDAMCCACRHITSLIAGIIFQKTKLPLTTCFLAIHLSYQPSQVFGIGLEAPSGCELSHGLVIGSLTLSSQWRHSDG